MSFGAIKVRGLLLFFLSSIQLGTAQSFLEGARLDRPVKLLPDVVSSEHDEFDILFSKNMDSLFFTRRIQGKPQKIYLAKYQNEEWQPPVVVEFSTDRDEFPNFSKDGSTLYFGSTRPIPGFISEGNFDMNIWSVAVEKGRWGNPKPLDTIINKIQIKGEEWPSSNESTLTTTDDKTFYFSSLRRGDSLIQLYTTQHSGKEFSTPQKIEGLFDDDRYWKSSPVLSPDGNYLFFNAYATPSGFGGEDIYVSKVTSKGYCKAKNLGKMINSQREEAAPKFSSNGKYFFFARQDLGGRSEGDWNIYVVETQYLELEKLFQNE